MLKGIKKCFNRIGKNSKISKNCLRSELFGICWTEGIIQLKSSILIKQWDWKKENKKKIIENKKESYVHDHIVVCKLPKGSETALR